MKKEIISVWFGSLHSTVRCSVLLATGIRDTCRQLLATFTPISSGAIVLHQYSSTTKFSLMSYNPATLMHPLHLLYINYLCTYDLYSPVHNVLDAGISIMRGSRRGLGPGILEFFGPCEMVTSRFSNYLTTLVYPPAPPPPPTLGREPPPTLPPPPNSRTY